jgi:hypothetical protein
MKDPVTPERDEFRQIAVGDLPNPARRLSTFKIICKTDYLPVPLSLSGARIGKVAWVGAP